MDVTVNLKVTPQEFDLLRNAVADAKDRYYQLQSNVETTPVVRQEARELTVKLGDLLTKLK